MTAGVPEIPGAASLRGASPEAVAERILAGDERAAARAITWIESQDPRGGPVAATLRARIDPVAHRTIGITGPPGVGKSTLVDRLAEALIDAGETVGVVAVDPSSPVGGGAILGDRVRLSRIATIPGFFFRSMGSRGALGGIARATEDAVTVVHALGKRTVLVETVGAGQLDVAAAGIADTLVVVLMPGTGDGVQAIKAGILEVADVYVINKADCGGADNAARELELMLSLTSHPTGWTPPILAASAAKREGIAEILAAIDAHARHREETGHAATARAAHARARFRRALDDLLLDAAHARWLAEPGFRALEDRVARHEVDPLAAAAETVETLLARAPGPHSSPEATCQKADAGEPAPGRGVMHHAPTTDGLPGPDATSVRPGRRSSPGWLDLNRPNTGASPGPAAPPAREMTHAEWFRLHPEDADALHAEATPPDPTDAALVPNRKEPHP